MRRIGKLVLAALLRVVGGRAAEVRVSKLLPRRGKRRQPASAPRAVEAAGSRS
jgi:hypothetical protein